MKFTCYETDSFYDEMFVSGSIGVAVYPEDGLDGEALLKNADAAMYHAKDRGGNTCQLYSTSMNASAVARMRLERVVREINTGHGFIAGPLEAHFGLGWQPVYLAFTVRNR